MRNDINNLFNNELIFYTNNIELSRYYLSPFMIFPPEYRLGYINDHSSEEEDNFVFSMPKSILLFKEPITENIISRCFPNTEKVYPIAIKINFSEIELSNIGVYILKKDGNVIGIKKLIEFINGDYVAAILCGAIPLSKATKYVFRSENEKKKFLSFIAPINNLYLNENMIIVEESLFKGDNDFDIESLKKSEINFEVMHNEEDIFLINKIRALLFRIINDYKIESNFGLLKWGLNKNVIEMISSVNNKISDKKKKRKSVNDQNEIIKIIRLLIKGDKYKIEQTLIDDIEIPSFYGPLKRVNLKEYILHLINKSPDKINLKAILNYSSEEELFDSFCFLIMSKYLMINDIKERKNKLELVEIIQENVKEKLQEYIEEENKVDFRKIDLLKQEYVYNLSKIKDAINNKIKYTEVINSLPEHMESIKALTTFYLKRGTTLIEKDNYSKKNDKMNGANIIALEAITDGFNKSLDKEDRIKLDLIKAGDILLSIILEDHWPYYKEEIKVIRLDSGIDSIYVHIGNIDIPLVILIPINSIIRNKILEMMINGERKKEISDKIIDLVKKSGLLFYKRKYSQYFQLLSREIIIDNTDKEDIKYEISNLRSEIKSEKKKIRIRLEDLEIDASDRGMELFYNELKNKESNLLMEFILDSLELNRDATILFLKQIMNN